MKRVELINPRLTNDTCTSEGVTVRYVEFEFPKFITDALGLGCSGRHMSTFEGQPAPAVMCEDRGDHMVAVYWDFSKQVAA